MIQMDFEALIIPLIGNFPTLQRFNFTTFIMN